MSFSPSGSLKVRRWVEDFGREERARDVAESAASEVPWIRGMNSMLFGESWAVLG